MKFKFKGRKVKISAWYIVAAMFYVFASFALTITGFNIPATSRVTYEVIAVILLGFGLIFAGAVYRVAKQVNAQLQKLERPT